MLRKEFGRGRFNSTLDILLRLDILKLHPPILDKLGGGTRRKKFRLFLWKSPDIPELFL